MNDIYQAIVLGIVQGLGEFLPISSTAHLILVPYLFDFSDPGLSFDVALHIGTLIAVVGYFWKDWIEIFKMAFENLSQKSKTKSQKYGNRTLYLLVIATIPGVFAGYFLEEAAGTFFRNPLLIAFSLSLVGLILYLADKYLKHRKSINEVSFKDSLIIGIAQAVAIIPGVSRSGATITAGLFLGMDRVSAARFSFLLSTPIILGASILEFNNLLNNGFDMQVILGITFSALSGYLSIKYLLKLVEKISYKIFFWYRLFLAVIILVFYVLK